MIINDLYNNKNSSLSEGMKARDLAMYCEKLVAEKGWDAAYKHASFMAQGGTDPAWGSVLKYLQAMKDGMSEGRMVKGPGGVPLDRQGRPVVAKDKAPAPLKMRKWLVIHDGSHGEGGKDIIEAPNAETAWETANEYDLDIISITPYRGPARPTLVDEGVLDEAVGMIIKGAAISGSDDQDIADRIAARTGGRVDSGSRGHHILITYPTPQDRAQAAVKIRKMFPGIELYKSGGNRNAIDEQGVAEGMWDQHQSIPELEKAIENLIMGYKGGINLTDKGRAQLLLSINKGKRILAKKKQQQDMAEGSELKQAKRKYNQAAKDANLDQVGAGKKIDTMKKSLRQKDLGKEQGMAEASLGNYRKKAALSKATSQIDRFFGRDDPAKVAQADQTIAKRERGMARADARVKPYTAPPVDVGKRQRDLTAKYPNIDELVHQAELNRDPNYEMADGPAYYAGREAEQNYLKLKQIQRVIQGLNESQADTKKKELSTGTGRINPDTGRPWLPSELKAKYANVDFDKEATKAELKRLSDLAKQEKLKDKIKASLDDPRDTARDLAKSLINKGGLGSDFKTPSPVPPTPSPGPTTVQGQPPGFTAGNLAQQPGMAQYMQQKPVAPKPAPNFAQGPTGYKTATTNVPPTMSTTSAPPAEKNTSDILQALTKMGFKTKEAEAAIKRLPPNIGTNDAILQILRGKQMSESLTWSRNFNPGRSLYRRMKQDI